jgi:hypothetical protein
MALAVVAMAAKEPGTTGKALDPRADQALRGMSSYMSKLKSFRVDSQATDEVVLKNGEKVQSVTDSLVSVSRPNELSSIQEGPGGNLGFWYDGKKMTLYCKTNGTYATVDAPPTIDQTIDLGRAKYGLEAPGADLIYSKPYEALVENVTSSQYLGVENIDGVACDHLAFQQSDVDWQIWIQRGNQPLPRRYVITTKNVKNEPEFSAHLSNWQTQASLPAGAFAFAPPAGAKRVDQLPTSCPAAPPTTP